MKEPFISKLHLKKKKKKKRVNVIHKRRENVELKVATYIIKKFNAKKIYNVGKKKKNKKI